MKTNHTQVTIESKIHVYEGSVPTPNTLRSALKEKSTKKYWGRSECKRGHIKM